MAVLFFSGLLGFCLGMFQFPTWQVAVETSQVVANLVKYPAANPFYIYHTKLWTVLHQVCALLLLAGASEITLSKVLSGVLGMVSFQALAIFVYALSRDAVMAVGAPLVLFLSDVTYHGVMYPVLLMDTEHTYGSLGLSMVVLVTGLFASGHRRSAAFLMGLAPAVHPSLGIWLWLTAGIALAWDRQNLRPAIPYFLAGGSVTALSLLIQLSAIYDVPHVDPAISRPFVYAFIALWDGHRAPVKLFHGGVVLNVGGLLVSSLWLTGFARDLRRPALFLLRMSIVTASISLVWIAISRIPIERMPLTLLVLMPARLLNFNVMTYAALVFGLIGVYRDRLWAQVLTLCMAGGLLLAPASRVWGLLDPIGVLAWAPRLNPAWVLEIATVGLVSFAVITKVRSRSPSHPVTTAGSAGLLRFATIGLLGLTSAMTLTMRFPPRLLLDRTNDPFFATVAADQQGLLMTSGELHLIQLHTRRPVLLDGGGLDLLPYAPEAGPAMDRILRDAYQIDLLHPPPEALGEGMIPDSVNKRVWERFPPDKWREIRREFNITQVLSRSDYALNLPVVAQTKSLRLYRIPE